MVRSIPLSNGGVTLVDDADYDAVRRFPWRLNSKGYVMYTCTEDGQRHEVYLHRYLAQPWRRQVVDHLDHDPLNNTRANLRRCSVQENLRHRRRFSNNECGFKGVTARRSQWLARIYVNDRALKLGTYDDLLAAAQAYDFAARQLFHEFAVYNLPDDRPTPPEIETRVRGLLSRSRRQDVIDTLRRSPVWNTSGSAPARPLPSWARELVSPAPMRG